MVEVAEFKRKSNASGLPKGWNVGTLVILVSGGPVMTLRRGTGDSIEVDWFTEDGELHTANFLPAQLTLYTPPAEPEE